MTFTRQSRCAPIKKIIEFPPSQCEKALKTEAEEILDDMNSLYDSLCILNLKMHRLNCLVLKKIAEQKKPENAGFETGPNDRLESKSSPV